MSRKKGNKFVVEKQASQSCEYCGEIKELRPYGKNGANICFKCMMKNEDEAKKQFSKVLDGVEVVVLNNLN